GMDQLKTVSLPQGLIEIGDSSFFICTSLEEITLPSSLEKIGDSTFFTCKSLQDISFPDGLDYIGNHAFYNCSALEEVVLPDSVKTIEYNAFYNCSGLKEINIPLSIDYTGSQIFKGCPLLTTMEVPEGITILPGNMFNGMDQLKTVSLPEGMVEIGDNAFFNCTSLEEITLPSSLEKIGDSAFSRCTNLKELNLPPSVKEIGFSAFNECSSLTSFTYPVSLQYAGHSMFTGCSSLEEVIIPEGITKIADNAFSDLPCLKTISLPESLEEIGSYAFGGCDNLRFVIVPNNVSKIRDSAFANCENLRYVTIGATKCELEASVFHGSDKMFIYCQPVSDAARYAIVNNIPFTPISSEGNDYTDYITDMSSTRFYSDKTLAMVDSYIPLTLEYTLFEDRLRAVSDATISILFSENVEVMENRVELDGEAITDFTYDTNEGVLTIPVEKSSGKLKFYASVWDHGTVSALASLSYYSKGWQNENIALAYLDAPAIRFDAPATVSSGSLTITGATGKSKKILFTINGADAGNTTARKDGTFTYKLDLPAAEKEGEKFTVRAALAEDTTKYYEQSVAYETHSPVLTKFLMKYSKDTTVPFVDLLDDTQRLTLRVDPSDGFRFEIKFDNPEKLGTVFVGSSKNGKLSRLYAVPVGEGGEYVAEGFFDNDPNFLPGAINVYYNTYSDPNDYSTPLAKEDLPDAWKDAKNEVLEQGENVYRSRITLQSGDEIEYTVHENLTLAQIRHLVLGEPMSAEDDPELFGSTASELIFGFFDDIAINFTKNGVSTATSLHTAENGDLAMMVEDAPGETFWQIVWDNGKQAFQASAVSFAGTAAIQYFSPGVSWSNCGSAFGFISDSVGVVMHAYNDMVSVDDALNEIKSSTTLTAEQKKYATEQVEKMRSAYLGLNAFRFAGAVASYGLTLAYGPVVGALAGMVFDGIANIIEGYLDDAMAYYAAGGQGSYLKWLIDPSGYVYDVITNKRIKGATTWVYCILFEEDDDATFWEDIPSPDEYGTLWQAEEYSQQNPLTTDEEGKYAWDVPEGWWRVKCEMEGYETLWSDWLPVPPVQTEVNLGMFPAEMPEEYYYFDSFSKAVVISSNLETTCTVAVGAYTNDALTSIEIKENVTLTGSVTNVTMDKVITDGADSVKVFIWKDKASMLPLINQAK
ncbi:MAG: leucine-rich repeat protein, partial [Clostridia bacterium]|nr:leucine-rich repeat protein [Clostridia bacterium]